MPHEINCKLLETISDGPSLVVRELDTCVTNKFSAGYSNAVIWSTIFNSIYAVLSYSVYATTLPVKAKCYEFTSGD